MNFKNLSFLFYVIFVSGHLRAVDIENVVPESTAVAFLSEKVRDAYNDGELYTLVPFYGETDEASRKVILKILEDREEKILPLNHQKLEGRWRVSKITMRKPSEAKVFLRFVAVKRDEPGVFSGRGESYTFRKIKGHWLIWENQQIEGYEGSPMNPQPDYIKAKEHEPIARKREASSW
jgi:hypothetical protein